MSPPRTRCWASRDSTQRSHPGFPCGERRVKLSRSSLFEQPTSFDQRFLHAGIHWPDCPGDEPGDQSWRMTQAASVPVLSEKRSDPGLKDSSNVLSVVKTTRSDHVRKQLIGVESIRLRSPKLRCQRTERIGINDAVGLIM